MPYSTMLRHVQYIQYISCSFKLASHIYLELLYLSSSLLSGRGRSHEEQKFYYVSVKPVLGLLHSNEHTARVFLRHLM
jgi:hypothetical protein